MKIVPHSSILVRGVHCEAGKATEVPEEEGKQMIREGFARHFVEKPASPAVETTTAAPAAETAAVTPVKKQGKA